MLNTKKNTEEAKKVEFVKPSKVEVTSARPLENGVVMFDVIVMDSVRVSGMSARDYTNQKGETGTMINFPSYKGKNNKWYDYCFFPIDSALKEDIINQINSLIG